MTFNPSDQLETLIFTCTAGVDDNDPSQATIVNALIPVPAAVGVQRIFSPAEIRVLPGVIKIQLLPSNFSTFPEETV